MPETDVFEHSAPSLYDRHMVPLLFEPYAELLAERAAALEPRRVLETAAGTGAVTRAVARVLPEAEIVATDVNPGVLEYATAHFDSGSVTFQQANAQELPFPDESFDLVLSAFGVMFFPDKVRAHDEARRALRSGGRYLFVTFADLSRNPVPEAAGKAVDAMFPDDPPRYMERGPFSYTDRTQVEDDAGAAGFSDVAVETVELSSRVVARDAANGMVLGSPFRAEIEQRGGPAALKRALEAVVEALGPWDGKDAPLTAHVVTAIR